MAYNTPVTSWWAFLQCSGFGHSRPLSQIVSPGAQVQFSVNGSASQPGTTISCSVCFKPSGSASSFDPCVETVSAGSYTFLEKCDGCKKPPCSNETAYCWGNDALGFSGSGSIKCCSNGYVSQANGDACSCVYVGPFGYCDPNDPNAPGTK
jgi:hypothetical protein